MKSLAQISYEAAGGHKFFGPWPSQFNFVREIHEEIAAAVERAVLRRIKAKKKGKK